MNATTDSLPDACFAFMPGTTSSGRGVIIELVLDEDGYHETQYGMSTKAKLDDLNADLACTPAQRDAMLVGSLFGWDKPGARPEAHTKAI